MTTSPTAVRPSSSLDLFADEALADPYPLYEALRATGPAVWLTPHQMWAVTGYQDVKNALADPATFSSVDGVALTEQANRNILAGTVLASDGAEHTRLRRPLSRQLNPRAINSLSDRIRERADTLVAQHVRRTTFDAAQLAQTFVADTVMELMGLPPSTRTELIITAKATFDVFGPDNDRYRTAAPAAAAMIAFLHEQVTRETVQPGSWMAAIYEAVDAGDLTEDDAVPLMSAYTAAGMDSTIYAISTAIHLLATHPQAFRSLRSAGATGDQAFREALRYDAPIQAFGRRATRDTSIGGISIRSGEQVWLIYGATGRDPNRWGPDADSFRIWRPDTDHLAFGFGPHTCAGNHLAALEGRSLLQALAARSNRLKLAGKPVRALNNVLRGWESVPVEVIPDRRKIGR